MCSILAHAHGQNLWPWPKTHLWGTREPYLQARGARPSSPTRRQGRGRHKSDGTSARTRQAAERADETSTVYTVEEVADKLLCSATKISRLETGARRPSLRDVRDLCELYGLDEPTSTEFMTLAREARQQVWWTQYERPQNGPVSRAWRQAAVAITSYTMYYVPALLQTEEYTKEIIRTIAPKDGSAYTSCGASKPGCAVSSDWMKMTRLATVYCWMRRCCTAASWRSSR